MSLQDKLKNLPDSKVSMSFDKILNRVVLIAGLLAIFISFWQAFDAREHNRLSLKPYITSAYTVTGVDNNDGVFVSNDGMGPAFIKEAYIIANGKTFDLATNSWPAIYDHLHIKNGCHTERWFKMGSVIKSGDKIKLIYPTSATNDKECVNQFTDLLSHSELNLHIVYESIYEYEYKYSQRIGLNAQEIDRLK